MVPNRTSGSPWDAARNHPLTGLALAAADGPWSSRRRIRGGCRRGRRLRRPARNGCGAAGGVRSVPSWSQWIHVDERKLEPRNLAEKLVADLLGERVPVGHRQVRSRSG